MSFKLKSFGWTKMEAICLLMMPQWPWLLTWYMLRVRFWVTRVYYDFFLTINQIIHFFQSQNSNLVRQKQSEHLNICFKSYNDFFFSLVHPCFWKTELHIKEVFTVENTPVHYVKDNSKAISHLSEISNRV